MSQILRSGLITALFAASAAHAGQMLKVEVWARATIAGVPNAAVYGTFTNRGNKPAMIVSVSSPIAASAVIHKTVVNNGMVSMEPMKSLRIPAGQTVECRPGKCHIMLMGIKRQLKRGGMFKLTLGLQGGASMEVPVKVGTIGQMTAP